MVAAAIAAAVAAAIAAAIASTLADAIATAIATTAWAAIARTLFVLLPLLLLLLRMGCLLLRLLHTHLDAAASTDFALKPLPSAVVVLVLPFLPVAAYTMGTLTYLYRVLKYSCVSLC